jgi:hypothetical protein
MMGSLRPTSGGVYAVDWRSADRMHMVMKRTISGLRPPRIPRCCECLAENPRKVCSRCKRTKYCGRACQKRDWATHKLVCGPAEAPDPPRKLRDPGPPADVPAFEPAR